MRGLNGGRVADVNEEVQAWAGDERGCKIGRGFTGGTTRDEEG